MEKELEKLKVELNKKRVKISKLFKNESQANVKESKIFKIFNALFGLLSKLLGVLIF